MAHCGNLGSRRVTEGIHDVRGTTVRDSDGSTLGKVNDVLFDHDNMAIRYIVVDSGGWLARIFLLPATRLSLDEKHADGLATGTTREQIKNSPPYSKDTLQSKSDWNAYEQQFKEYWEDQPVMHIKGSDRIITPPEEPEPARATSPPAAPDRSGSGGVSAAQLFPERMSSVFSDPEPSSGKVTLRPKSALRAEQAASGVNLLKPRWWDAFENYLHINKRDIQAKCSECSSKAA